MIAPVQMLTEQERFDRACICGPMHFREHHGPTHWHSVTASDRGDQPCPFECCVVDGCDCDEFRSEANAAERQWEHQQREAYNS